METSESPKVFIIILNWNGWKDTIECLDSLRHLTYANYEIIVIDNASSDDSVAKIKTAYSNLEIIKSSENGGFAKGNNLGMREAISRSAEYVWLLNNDTTVSSSALTELVKKAQSSERIGIVGSVLYEYYEPWKIQAWGGGSYNRKIATTSHYHQENHHVDHIIGASMFINGKTIKKIGYLDERLFFFLEDTEYSRRAIDNDWELAVSPSSWVFHKGGSSLREGNLNEVKDYKSFQKDLLYTRAVGTYMKILKIPLLFVLARYFLIIGRRIQKRQTHRIAPLSKAYWQSYKKLNEV